MAETTENSIQIFHWDDDNRLQSLETLYQKTVQIVSGQKDWYDGAANKKSLLLSWPDNPSARP